MSEHIGHGPEMSMSGCPACLEDGRAAGLKPRGVELWNLDTFLARFLANAVDEFRENQHGHPGTLTPDEWDAILAEMVEGFRAYDDCDKERPTRALELLTEWWCALWD